MTAFNRKWHAALVLACLALLLAVGTSQIRTATATVVTPPYGTDVSNVGALIFYDSAGNQITGGSITAFARYVQGTQPGRTGAVNDTKATLFGYLPQNGVAVSAWTGVQISTSTTYPNLAAPAALAGSPLPLVTFPSQGTAIQDLASDLPNTATDAYKGLYQLRLKTSAPGQVANTVWESADIYVDTAAGTWSVIYPAESATTSTTVAPTTTTVAPTTSTVAPTTTTVAPTTTTTVAPTTTTVAPTTTTTVAPTTTTVAPTTTTTVAPTTTTVAPTTTTTVAPTTTTVAPTTTTTVAPTTTTVAPTTTTTVAPTTTTVAPTTSTTVAPPKEGPALELSQGSVTPGGTFSIHSPGWKPEEPADVTLHSDPIKLGTLTADEDGNLSGSFSIPSDAPVGSHSVVVTGVAADGSAVESTAALTVVDSSGSTSSTASSGSGTSPTSTTSSGQLPVTGAATVPLLVLGLGLVAGGLVVLTVRRRALDV